MTFRPPSTPRPGNCPRICRARRPIVRSIPRTRRSSFSPSCRTSSRSSPSTTRPKTFSPNASARSRAFRWCGSAASSSRRSASRSIRPNWSRRTCSSRTCARRSRSPPSTTPRARSTAIKQSYTIFDNDQLTEAKPWNDVIIAYRNGAPVRVRDIGVAVAGPVDTTQAAWSNGKRSVFLVVFKQPGVNVIKTVESIKTGPGQAGGVDSARHPCRRDIRPHHDDPRLGRGRAIHAAADHRRSS